MAFSSGFFQKPRRLLGLIVASLAFLGLSQLLWINRVWREQNDALKQEANYIFQQTVFALQDSLVMRNTSLGNLPDLHGAEWRHRMPPFLSRHIVPSAIKLHESESAQVTIQSRVFGNECKDSLTHQVELCLSDNDTTVINLKKGLGRVFLNTRHDSVKAGSRLVFEFNNDTITPGELTQNFAKALENKGLPASVQLYINREPIFDFTGKLATEPAMAGLFKPKFYTAELTHYRSYLIKKTAPYVFFSLFLLGLTSLAFWLIFKSLRQQQRLSLQKTEFISNITHELKTPLTTVGVALEALHEFDVLRNPEKTREYLQISKLELDRLNLLVDKVLRLSMFEQQALHLKLESINLNDVVQQVVNAMSLQAKAAGAVIQCELSEAPCPVVGDRLHLTGVVYNLLDNALKYRSKKPVIDIKLKQLEKEGRPIVALTVNDNGIGIAAEDQKKVFDKFYRVPVGNTHNVKGHGLGLSYVAHVIQQHGGSILLESQLGQGSTFMVQLPVANPE